MHTTQLRWYKLQLGTALGQHAYAFSLQAVPAQHNCPHEHDTVMTTLTEGPCNYPSPLTTMHAPVLQHQLCCRCQLRTD